MFDRARGNAAGLAMKTGAAWPVIFGISPGSGVVACSLKPVGWVPSSLGSLPAYSGIKAEAAGNGQVAAAWSTGSIIEFAQSSSDGWLRKSFQRSSLSEDTPDVAFLASSDPVLAYSESSRMTLQTYSGSGWDRVQINTLIDPMTGQPINPTALRVSVAVESQGDVCLAFAEHNNIGFAFRDSATGTWYGKPISSLPQWSDIRDISLAFGLNDKVGMAFRDGNNRLFYSSYDPSSGIWLTELVVSEVQSEHINLVFDQLGNPAFAYVKQGVVHYATEIGIGWAHYPLTTYNYIPTPNSDAALAFDTNNLPVIAYNCSSGRMILAYDPPLTPEPTSSLLLIAGAIMMTCRRRVV